MKNWKQVLLVVLTLPIIGWTVLVTWSATRISAFIIYSDEVWKEMVHWGYGLEVHLASAIGQLRSMGLVTIVIGSWTLFLVQLPVVLSGTNSNRIQA